MACVSIATLAALALISASDWVARQSGEAGAAPVITMAGTGPRAALAVAGVVLAATTTRWRCLHL
jgi:hypothetical protein